jgi:hypothetical protein
MSHPPRGQPITNEEARAAVETELFAMKLTKPMTPAENARGVPVTVAMSTKFASLTPDEHIDTAVETSLHTSQREFPVVDGMGRPVGLLARNDLIRALKERGPHGRVADAMSILRLMARVSQYRAGSDHQNASQIAIAPFRDRPGTIDDGADLPIWFTGGLNESDY